MQTVCFARKTHRLSDQATGAGLAPCARPVASSAPESPRAASSSASSRRTRPGASGSREEDGSERDRARSGGEKVERIAAGCDPAHAHDRQSRRAVALVDGGERDRLQGRSGVASELVPEPRLERLVVEREAADRVHEREAVRACGLDRAGGLREVGRGRRELRVERLSGLRPRRGDELGGALGRFLDVRARQVELDRRHFPAVVERGAELGVVVRREAADGDPERDSELGQTRKLVLEQAVDARGSRARSS